MTKRIAFLLFSILIISLFAACDFLSEGGNMTNVRIPLFGDTGSRAVGASPPGTEITGFTVSVFGPGMSKITKNISVGSRYVNMYVPAGQERHFTLEVHIAPPDKYTYQHMRSFIGRATADLRPGYFVGIKFEMHAGATQLFIPDNTNGDGKIWSADSIDWNNNASAPYARISDIDIAHNGLIYVSNNSGELIHYGSRISSLAGNILINRPVNTISIDRERKFLYYVSANTTPQLAQIPLDYETGRPTGQADLKTTGLSITLNRLFGVAADPWTGYLYLTGRIVIEPEVTAPVLIKYDPFYSFGKPPYGRVLNYTTLPQMVDVKDVIVKDSGVFVLNSATLTDPVVPSILKFDRDLNLIGQYGTLSQNGEKIMPSTSAGDFYYPSRFFAIENNGLFIVDDSDAYDDIGKDTLDKIIKINESLDSGSWKTYPREQQNDSGQSLDPFRFFVPDV